MGIFGSIGTKTSETSLGTNCVVPAFKLLNQKLWKSHPAAFPCASSQWSDDLCNPGSTSPDALGSVRKVDFTAYDCNCSFDNFTFNGD